jgi:hypothetical protein
VVYDDARFSMRGHEPADVGTCPWITGLGRVVAASGWISRLTPRGTLAVVPGLVRGCS